MRNRLLTFAGVLAPLAVLGNFYARPLLAQLRGPLLASLVASLDEPARAPYQVMLTLGPCTSSCSVVTLPVAANKRLHLTHISAAFLAASNSTTEVSVVHTDHLAFNLAYLNSNGFVNQPLDSYFDSGESVRVAAQSALLTEFTGDVILTGYLIDCTAAPCASTVKQ